MKGVEHGLIRDRTVEELVDALARHEADPYSAAGTAIRMAILAQLLERVATPRRWALVAIAAAVVSALGTVASAIIIATA